MEEGTFDPSILNHLEEVRLHFRVFSKMKLIKQLISETTILYVVQDTPNVLEDGNMLCIIYQAKAKPVILDFSSHWMISLSLSFIAYKRRFRTNHI